MTDNDQSPKIRIIAELRKQQAERIQHIQDLETKATQGTSAAAAAEKRRNIEAKRQADLREFNRNFNEFAGSLFYALVTEHTEEEQADLVLGVLGALEQSFKALNQDIQLGVRDRNPEKDSEEFTSRMDRGEFPGFVLKKDSGQGFSGPTIEAYVYGGFHREATGNDYHQTNPHQLNDFTKDSDRSMDAPIHMNFLLYSNANGKPGKVQCNVSLVANEISFYVTAGENKISPSVRLRQTKSTRDAMEQLRSQLAQLKVDAEEFLRPKR